MLHERQGEADVLRGLFEDAIRGEGGLGLILGPPGIGKTALVDALREHAEARGATVLTARGAELDRPFSFGVARQALERRLHAARDVERALLTKGAARHGLVALGDDLGEHGETDGTRALHGLYWMLVNLSSGAGPVVLCVDDVHWADRSSLRWLAHTARRLEGLRLLLVLSSRPAEPGADQDLLDALEVEASATIRPVELSAAGIRQVINTELATAPDAPFLAACLRATGGNPLLVHALAGQLRRDSVPPVAASAASVAEIAAGGIAQAVRRRMARLGGAAGTVVGAVAVLGDGCTARAVRRITDLADDDLREAVAGLVAVQVLADGATLAFVHPLVRAAVYDAIPVLVRAGMHRAAAAVLMDTAAEPESVARHLLLAEPVEDAMVAGGLLAAGRDASRRGAPDAAVRYLQRALAEPPPESLRGEVLLELGTAGARIRAPGFQGHLREAMALATDPDLKGEIALRLVGTLTALGGIEEAGATLDAAFACADPGSPAALLLEATAIATYQGWPRLFSDEWQQRADSRFVALEAGEALDPITLCGLLGYVQRVYAPADRCEPLIGGSLAVFEDLITNRTMSSGALIPTIVFGLANMGRLAEADALARRVEAEARRRGETISLIWALGLRAEIALRAGRLTDAESDVRAGYDLARDDTGVEYIGPVTMVWMRAVAAIVLVERGHAGEAHDVLETLPAAAWDGHTVQIGLLFSARAAVACSRGRTGEAIADLRTAVRRGAASRNPSQNRWRSPAALLLAARGDHEEAIALAGEDLALAQEFSLPIAIGTALVALGVARRGEAGLRHLREAVRTLAATEARLEHARALIELGAALRRAGRPAQARDPLREGLDLATACGAVLDTQHARDELIAAGGRPRRDRRALHGPESLTTGEHRVARLAAVGLTNREIAERLFVTQAAVQWHLRNTFRKLELTSRRELAGRFGPPTAHEVPEGDELTQRS